MWHDRPKDYNKPEKAEGEGWLRNEQQELAVLITPAQASAHATSVINRVVIPLQRLSKRC